MASDIHKQFHKLPKKRQEEVFEILRSKELWDFYNLMKDGASDEEIRKANNRLKLRTKKIKGI